MKTVTYAVEGYKPPITVELRVLVDCHRTEGNSRDFIVYTVRKYGVNKPSVGNTGFMGQVCLKLLRNSKKSTGPGSPDFRT